MKKTVATLIMTALLSVVLAGCIGGGGFGSGGIPRAVVTINQVDEFTYVFDARDSSGSDLTYAWDFGDGTTSDEARVEHHFQYGDGTYNVRLVIEDPQGTPDVWEDEVVVGTGENRPPVAQFNVGPRNHVLNTPVTVDASASWDPEDDPLRFRWDFNHLMDFDEYEAFRAAKQAALQGLDDDDFELGGGGGGGDGNGAPQSAPGSLEELLRDVDPAGIFGDKHPPQDDDGRIQPSLFSHVAETDEPVYTLDAGFPDATIFFIRLQVWDVKGAHEEILSEEIWPVEVWTEGTFPQPVTRDSREGHFDFGVPQEVADNILGEVPDMELYQYETEFSFEIPWPVADTVNVPDYFPGGFINLTWEAESDDLMSAAGDLTSELQINITTPDGTVLGDSSTDGTIRLELHGQNDYVGDNWQSPWEVTITARSGLNIDWQFEYWVKMDTNPFTPWEADYV